MEAKKGARWTYFAFCGKVDVCQKHSMVRTNLNEEAILVDVIVCDRKSASHMRSVSAE